MKEFDWIKFCIPCGGLCCRGENLYFSEEDLKKIQQKYGLKFEKGEKHRCPFLDEGGRCKIYDERPFECKIFPFDIEWVNKKLKWIIWEVCPAHNEIDIYAFIEYFERELSKDYSLKYIGEYGKHHEVNELAKYKHYKYKVLSDFQWQDRPNRQ